MPLLQSLVPVHLISMSGNAGLMSGNVTGSVGGLFPHDKARNAIKIDDFIVEVSICQTILI